jgi:hypothetical protein
MLLYLLDGLHKTVLIGLAQTLNVINELLVPLALHTDRDSHPTHNQCFTNIVIFRNRLQVGHVEVARRALQNIRKVLGHQSIESLQ